MYWNNKRNWKVPKTSRFNAQLTQAINLLAFRSTIVSRQVTFREIFRYCYCVLALKSFARLKINFQFSTNQPTREPSRGEREDNAARNWRAKTIVVGMLWIVRARAIEQLSTSPRARASDPLIPRRRFLLQVNEKPITRFVWWVCLSFSSMLQPTRPVYQFLPSFCEGCTWKTVCCVALRSQKDVTPRDHRSSADARLRAGRSDHVQAERAKLVWTWWVFALETAQSDDSNIKC